MHGSSVFIYGKIPVEELRSETPERLRECNVNKLTDMCTFAPFTPQAAGFSEQSSSSQRLLWAEDLQVRSGRGAQRLCTCNAGHAK